MMIFFFSCGWEEDARAKKGFYTYTTLYHRDNYRLPIIQPYSITSDDKGESWHFQSEAYGEHEFSTLKGAVISIGIIDSVRFVVHTAIRIGFTGGSEIIYYWQIINAKEKTSIESKTEKEYLAHLSSLGIDSVKLYDNLDYLYNEFHNNKVLPPEWDIVCKK